MMSMSGAPVALALVTSRSSYIVGGATASSISSMDGQDPHPQRVLMRGRGTWASQR